MPLSAGVPDFGALGLAKMSAKARLSPNPGLGFLRLMIEILHDLNDPKLWELWVMQDSYHRQY